MNAPSPMFPAKMVGSVVRNPEKDIHSEIDERHRKTE